MSNMSYCRFRNTLSDLRDCKDALEALSACATEECEPLSPEELSAAKKLVQECFSVVELMCDQTGADLTDGERMDTFEEDAAEALDRMNDELRAELEAQEAAL